MIGCSKCFITGRTSHGLEIGLSPLFDNIFLSVVPPSPTCSGAVCSRSVVVLYCSVL